MDRSQRVAASVHRLRELIATARRPGWRGRTLYALAGVPLAAVYAGVFAALVGSGLLVVYGVGVLCILALLAVTRGIAGMERRLARRLLGLAIPAGERVRHQPDVVRALRRLVTAPSTWRALGWLGARVIIGAATLATVAFGVAGLLGLGLGVEWTPITGLPLLVAMTAVVGLTLLVLDLLVRLSAVVAPRLLGSATEETIAALEQTSRRLADGNRIARDLHDTIGHALTASLLQAAAARRTLIAAEDAGPVPTEFARQALGHIESNTRTALAELDRALRVLRTHDPAAGPVPFTPPSLGDLEDLLAGLRDGGLPVALVVDGGIDDVPPAVGELAYRVVQEGTTNVLRHAGCPLTVVQVVREGDALVVRVCNERSTQLDSRPGPGGGRGLAGLRDRAVSAGGTLAAGPTAAGGFELCVTLPLTGRS